MSEEERIELEDVMSSMDIPEHSTPDTILQAVFRTNQKIWLWCAQKGVDFIYASSPLTYDGPNHNLFKDGLASPHKLMPRSILGWAHNLMDLWLHKMELDTEVISPPRTIAFKAFNLYGLYKQHPGGSFIDEVADLIHAHRPVPLWVAHSPDIVDGGYVRHFLHVEHCAEAIVKLLGSPHIASNIINLAGHHGITLKDAALLIGKILKKPVSFQKTPIHHKRPHLIERPCLHQLDSLGLLTEESMLEEILQRDLS